MKKFKVDFLKNPMGDCVKTIELSATDKTAAYMEAVELCPKEANYIDVKEI